VSGDAHANETSGGRRVGASLEHEVLRRLADIEHRLRDVQSMATRAYETSFDWPHVLDEIRGEPDYESAFEGEPLVSVRVTTFNMAEALCERALPSLRAQSYENWEALVVGDACTDDTEERIRAIGDARIRFWNLPWRGPYPDDPHARWLIAGTAPANVALREGHGAWLASLDHDDEWDADHLETLIRAAQEARAEVAYARIRVVDGETGEHAEMGAWPPERGEFGFLAAVCHRGLRRFEFDANARFADEPGDWNRARRMWDSGVRFAFVDRPLATNHFTKRHDSLSTEMRMIEELRGWVRELEDSRDWWRTKAEKNERKLVRVRAVLRRLDRLRVGRR
jgi:hypothetical protein